MTTPPPVPPPATPPTQVRPVVPQKKKWAAFDQGWANLIGPVVAALIGAGATLLAVHLTSSNASTSSSETASVSIDSSTNPDVSRSATFTGSVNNLQPGDTVWTFVLPIEKNGQVNETYPADGPCTVAFSGGTSSGTWNCEINVGSTVINASKMTGTYRVCPAVLSLEQADAVVKLLQKAALNKASDPYWFSSPPPYLDEGNCTTVQRTS